jgi:hypothetical protein
VHGGYQRVSFVGGEGVRVRVKMGTVMGDAFDDLRRREIGPTGRKRSGNGSLRPHITRAIVRCSGCSVRQQLVDQGHHHVGREMIPRSKQRLVRLVPYPFR